MCGLLLFESLIHQHKKLESDQKKREILRHTHHSAATQSFHQWDFSTLETAATARPKPQQVFCGQITHTHQSFRLSFLFVLTFVVKNVIYSGLTDNWFQSRFYYQRCVLTIQLFSFLPERGNYNCSNLSNRYSTQ